VGINIMIRFIYLFLVLLVSPVSIAFGQTIGPLQAGKNLSDLPNPSAARNNIGAAPTANPTFTGTVTLPAGTTLTTPTLVSPSMYSRARMRILLVLQPVWRS
jgi:hypothetical protein